jgi:hypothetical protein
VTAELADLNMSAAARQAQELRRKQQELALAARMLQVCTRMDGQGDIHELWKSGGGQ